ncbi:Alpha-ketoglutarate-dependent sulfonate dioxygenase [Candida viswanathii]|uniref:Alpha-ketoglutarate-dependent sulfonate dioxygenase n=1 Tax=Candida viswanathii TaxID=5486 RepID=A0A367YFN0_9ASCO|nr:Alpha-ketoglutarate-dependent sulfonate dioxygenase [Candida viswanathii]
MPARYVQVAKALFGSSSLVPDAKGNVSVSPEAAANINKDAHPYLPTWTRSEKYEPYEFIEVHDPAVRANKDLPNLFPKDGKYETNNISPKLGTEIKGIQLSQLDDAAKDELALFAAQRGVLVFRDQDFLAKGPEYISEYVNYFGPTHIHPTSGAPKGAPDVHVVLSGGTQEDPFVTRNNLVGFHSDVSYELNPTALSFLAATNIPKAGGGDTVFASNTEAYERLSPLLRERLEGLKAVHSGVDQANLAVFKKGVVKRHPVENTHPIIRTTPLGQKVLYVNNGFTKRIEGLKEEESSVLLKFLLEHVWKGHDFQIRAHWEPNTVVLFDNRVVSHSAILDFDTTDRRLIIRAAARGERPVEDLKDLNKKDENNVYHGPEYLGDRLESLAI